MRIVILVRSDISVLWIRILGAAVAAGLVALEAVLDSKVVVDMDVEDEMAAVAMAVVAATKEYV